ncbi:MAG: bifunctional diaminohydroxyphosphoribosylaminopyrimidine deaminase/5-amino-6-(5-phosphoribosylamino)uracil reductase RibD [Myxococcota bacterium]
MSRAFASEERDERWMALAAEAARGGRTSPNPHVGAVIVKDGKHLATGFHARAGEAHAEVAAIANAGDESLVGATIYVTMEPCNHYGRTPPCTEAIMDAGFGRVVVGYRDPAPHVPGALERLEAAGIEVRCGVLEDECRELIADFEKHITTGLPYVELKAAVSLDGRMATESGDSKWITGEASRTQAHRMRDRADAVAVGVDTVLADDPALTVRHVEGRDPIRVVFDTTLRTPPSSKVLRGGALVLHGEGRGEGREAALIDAGAELLPVPVRDGRVDLKAGLRVLAKRDIVRLLVEGGGVLQGGFLREGLADAATLFVAPVVLGGGRSFADGASVNTVAEGWRLSEVRTCSYGMDTAISGVFPKQKES